MKDFEYIELKVSENYIIDLIGMGNVGYSWIYQIDKKDLITISHQYIVPSDPKPGDRGIERFIISGNKPGLCQIEFKQIQSWEKSAAPYSIKNFQIKII